MTTDLQTLTAALDNARAVQATAKAAYESADYRTRSDKMQALMAASEAVYEAEDALGDARAAAAKAARLADKAAPTSTQTDAYLREQAAEAAAMTELMDLYATGTVPVEVEPTAPTTTEDHPMTTASTISVRFNNDGHCWTDDDGVRLVDAVSAARTSVEHNGEVFIFADGSAIALTDAGWDLVTLDTDGSAWVSEGGWRFER